jgi:outer membrane protein, multidrug efflux system
MKPTTSGEGRTARTAAVRAAVALGAANGLPTYGVARFSALADVDNALAGVAQTREQLAATTRQVAALSDYASLARDLYEGGYTSYLEALDAERSLF